MTWGKSLFLLHSPMSGGFHGGDNLEPGFEGCVGVGGVGWLAGSANFANVCAYQPVAQALAPSRGQGGVVEAHSCPRPGWRAR